MPHPSIQISAAQISKARALLVEAEERSSALGTLGAAALAATAAVLMAGVMVLGPGVALDHPKPQAATTL